MIRSVYYEQDAILASIMALNGIDRFDVDVTFGNGAFYKNIPTPVHCFDIDPALVDTPASSDDLPLGDSSVGSLVFDPPFLTYIRDAREGNGSMVMARRFGGYWRYDELEAHYRSTLVEAARVLRGNGIMVFKCQDIIHNHRMHPTHVNVINWAEPWFRVKDLFILPAKHRMAVPQQPGTAKRVQRHARIYHSYFLVLERKPTK